MSYRAGVALKLKIFSCRLRISCSFPSFDEFKSSYWYLYLNLLHHKVVHNNHHLPVKKMWIEKNFIREWFQFFLHSNCIYLGRLKHHEKPQFSQNNGCGLRIPLYVRNTKLINHHHLWTIQFWIEIKKSQSDLFPSIFVHNETINWSNTEKIREGKRLATSTHCLQPVYMYNLYERICLFVSRSIALNQTW